MKGSENVKKPFGKPEEDGTKTVSERYLARLKAYGDYYVMLVCFVAVCAAAAVGIALFFSVLIGLALAIACSAVYLFCTKSEAKNQLGLCVEHIRGTVYVKKADAVYGDELIIPDRIELARVTHICDGAFSGVTENDLKVIYIPCGICYIGRNIFGENGECEVRFEGTATEWERIEKHTDIENVVCGADYPRLPKKSLRLPFVHLKKSEEGEE